MSEPITMWSEPLTFMAVESGAPGPIGPAGPAGPQYGLRCNVSSIVRGLVAPISPTSIEFKALVNNADGTQEEVACGTDFRIELTQTSWDEGSAQTVNFTVSDVLIGYGTGQSATAYITKTVNLNYILRDPENDQIILEDRSYTRTGGNSDVSAIRASLYKGDIVLVELAIPFVLANELIDLGMVDENGQVIIGDGRVVASSVVANSITGDKIAAGTLTADKLFGNRLDSISPPPSFPSIDENHFTSEGARISLSNGGSIHFKNFYIDPTGNISLRGAIEAQSGSIVGKLGIGQAVNGEYPIYINGSPDSQYSLYVNGKFMVSPNGDMTANSGKIAGWLIEENQLVSENHSTGMYSGAALLKEGSPVRFFAGKDNDDYNFIVNDAGYVFAKNAQIQGRIDASSGSITGPLWIGSTTNGVLIDGENGSLQSTPFVSSAVGWRIDKGGNAEFNNATVRGKLTSVIFEMSTVSSVGGDLYIAPTVDIPKEKAGTIENNADNFYLHINNTVDERSKYMDSSWNNSQVKINLTAALNNGKETSYSGLNGSVVLSNNEQQIDITISKNDAENKKILALQSGESLASVVNTITVLKLGVGNNKKYIYLTASSNSSPFIDVQDYDVSDTTVLPKVRMGRLDGIVDNANGFGKLDGYGLYCNRAYLTGALNLPNAGITNQTIVGYNGGETYLPTTDSTASPVRIWAGGTEQPQAGGAAAPFIVTQDGSLYASKGVFKGQVIATNSEFSGSIRAAGILIDKGGDGYEPQKASNHFFVGYTEEPTTFNDYVLDMNSAGLSIWEGGLRAYSDEMSGWIGDDKTNTAVLPYGYTETNTKPYPYLAAIDAGRLMTKDWHNLTIAEDYSAYSIGTKNGKLYLGHTGAPAEKDNYLSYEEAQYEKIEGYGYLGVDTNQNLTLQSTRIMNINGTQVKMSTGQVRVDNPAGKAEISLGGAIMRQAIQDNIVVGLDFIFE